MRRAGAARAGFSQVLAAASAKFRFAADSHSEFSMRASFSAWQGAGANLVDGLDVHPGFGLNRLGRAARSGSVWRLIARYAGQANS